MHISYTYVRRQHEESSRNLVPLQTSASLDIACHPRIGPRIAIGRDANAARYLAAVGPDHIQLTETFEDGLIVLRATCPSKNERNRCTKSSPSCTTRSDSLRVGDAAAKTVKRILHAIFVHIRILMFVQISICIAVSIRI